jgi:hypothetical protein
VLVGVVARARVKGVVGRQRDGEKSASEKCPTDSDRLPSFRSFLDRVAHESSSKSKALPPIGGGSSPPLPPPPSFPFFRHYPNRPKPRRHVLLRRRRTGRRCSVLGRAQYQRYVRSAKTHPHCPNYLTLFLCKTFFLKYPALTR